MVGKTMIRSTEATDTLCMTSKNLGAPEEPTQLATQRRPEKDTATIAFCA